MLQALRPVVALPRLLVAVLLVAAAACDTVDTHVAPAPTVVSPPEPAPTTPAREIPMAHSTPPRLLLAGEGPRALLTHLAERLLDAPGSPARRLTTDPIVLVGTVTERGTRIVPASDAVHADGKVMTDYVVQDELTFVRVELELVASAGIPHAPTRIVVWPERNEVSTADVLPGFSKGASGIAFLRPHDQTLLGSEASAAFPDSLAPAAPLPCMVVGPVDAWADALRWWGDSAKARSDGPGALLSALGTATGPGAQVTLVGLSSGGEPAARGLASWVHEQPDEDARTLLGRAVLLRLGHQTEALDGLALDRLDATTLARFGVQVDGARVLGPPPGSPIPSDVP